MELKRRWIMRCMLIAIMMVAIFSCVSCSNTCENGTRSESVAEESSHISKESAEVLTLKKIKDRPYNPVTLSKEFMQKVKEETNGLKENEIVAYCNEKTRDILEFSTKCEKFDDRKKTKMHCVGYAQVLATICNYAFR